MEKWATKEKQVWVFNVLYNSNMFMRMFGLRQTVGVLTVAEASVSGVYRCIASNSAGTDQLDVPFYVTGDWVKIYYDVAVVFLLVVHMQKPFKLFSYCCCRKIQLKILNFVSIYSPHFCLRTWMLFCFHQLSDTIILQGSLKDDSWWNTS